MGSGRWAGWSCKPHICIWAAIVAGRAKRSGVVPGNAGTFVRSQGIALVSSSYCASREAGMASNGESFFRLLAVAPSAFRFLPFPFLRRALDCWEFSV